MPVRPYDAFMASLEDYPAARERLRDAALETGFDADSRAWELMWSTFLACITAASTEAASAAQNRATEAVQRAVDRFVEAKVAEAAARITKASESAEWHRRTWSFLGPIALIAIALLAFVALWARGPELTAAYGLGYSKGAAAQHSATQTTAAHHR